MFYLPSAAIATTASSEEPSAGKFELAVTRGKHQTLLHVADLASRFQVVSKVSSTAPAIVLRALMRSWKGWAGTPRARSTPRAGRTNSVGRSFRDASVEVPDGACRDLAPPGSGQGISATPLEGRELGAPGDHAMIDSKGAAAAAAAPDLDPSGHDEDPQAGDAETAVEPSDDSHRPRAAAAVPSWTMRHPHGQRTTIRNAAPAHRT